eukprot:188862-Prorocentrum_minimum.AAC.1
MNAFRSVRTAATLQGAAWLIRVYRGLSAVYWGLSAGLSGIISRFIRVCRSLLAVYWGLLANGRHAAPAPSASQCKSAWGYIALYGGHATRANLATRSRFSGEPTGTASPSIPRVRGGRKPSYGCTITRFALG